MMPAKLKAPFPYFGGKSKVAALVWDRLGDVDNFIEPFFGSGAVLLLRSHAPKIETVNDLDSYCANFWRATQRDPEAVASYADGAVNEVDLHSRHKWLVLSDDAAAFRQRMRTDPDYYDSKVAGWWVWGLCCWIGSGWCSVDSAEVSQLPLIGDPPRGEPRGADDDLSQQVPRLSAAGQGINSEPALSQQVPAGQRPLTGVHAKGQDARKPRLDGGEGQYGHGVHAKGDVPEQLPMLTGGYGYGGRAIHADRVPELHQKRQALGNRRGEHRDDGNRPQLADAFSRGRGVHGNDAAETCANRRAWLLDWFGRLRDRLRTVRVCCGDWSRVCSSESVTTRLGVTGVFLDPPYSTEAGRNNKLYAQESGTVAHDVRAWCLERGADPMMRIVLCGYTGEGHEKLEAAGWECVSWKTGGGYGNRSEAGKANAAKERLWFSPHTLKCELPLFTGASA